MTNLQILRPRLALYYQQVPAVKKINLRCASRLQKEENNKLGKIRVYLVPKAG